MGGATILRIPDSPISRMPGGPGIAPIIPGQQGLGPIPNYLFGYGPGATSSVPNGNTLNATATPAQIQQQQVAAENAVLRLVYGRQSVGAQIVDVLFYNGNLVVFVCWGQGPINAVESLWIDDKVPAASVVATHYTGTQVAADATLVAAYAAQSPAIVYTDILPGIAYSVITLPPGVTTGFPRITAIIQGLKVWEPRGKAINLTGAKHADATSAATINFGTGSFTVEAWAYHTDFTNPATFFPAAKFSGAGWNTLPGWGIGSGYNGAAIAVFMHDGTHFINSTIACDSGLQPSQLSAQWVHVAIVFDRVTTKTARAYINGVLQSGSVDISTITNSVNNSDVFQIGNSVGWTMDGLFDEVRLWNVARTAAQVADYMTKRAIGTETGLAMCWHADEGTGLVLGDATANANTGAAMAGSTWGAGYPLGPATTADAVAKAIYSENPAVVIGDIQTNTTYGAAGAVDWSSVGTVGDACDALVTGTEKRRVLGLVLDQALGMDAWLETLRAYAGCFLARNGARLVLIPDRPAASSFTFSEVPF